MLHDSAIVTDSEILNGIPCFRGTRVPFKNLIDYLEGGHSLGEFLSQFPTVTHEVAVQSLEEATRPKWRDFKGLKNEILLRAAEQAGPPILKT